MKTDCINWQGAKSAEGYGRIRWNDKTMLVHRVLFELAFGKIKRGLFVCHHCDNPSCINPAHLYAGTAKQNADDMVRRGRVKPWGRAITHCPQGHAYDKQNTYTHNGMRHCRQCGRERARVYQAQKRAAALAKAGAA